MSISKGYGANQMRNRKNQQSILWYIVLALFTGLIVNISMALVLANADAAHPAVIYTFKGPLHDHIPLYFTFANGYANGVGLSEDPCILESQGSPGPRIHAGHAFFGILHKLIQDPFMTVFIGNTLVAALIVLVLMIISRREFRLASLGIGMGAWLFLDATASTFIKIGQYVLSLGGNAPVEGLLQFGVNNAQYVLSRIFPTLYFFIVMLLFLHAFNSRKIFVQILAGVSVGLAFYIHIYLGIVLSGALGLAVLFLAIRRDSRWKIAGILLVIAAVVAIPFFINTVIQQARPDYPDLAFRFDLQPGRFLIIPPVFLLFFYAASSVIVWKSKRSFALKIFLETTIAATLIASELQLLLGTSLQPQSLLLWFYTLLLPLMLVIVLNDFVLSRTASHTKSRVLTAFVILSLALLLFQNVLAYQAASDTVYPIQEWHETLQWMDGHLTPNDVVLAPTNLTRDIAIQTSAKLYLCPAFNNLRPYEELMRRYVYAAYLYGTDPRSILAPSNEYDDWFVSGAFFFHNSSPHSFGDYLTDTPYRVYFSQDTSSTFISKNRELYMQILNEPPTNIYALDYVVVPNGMVQPIGTIVYQNSEYRVVNIEPLIVSGR